MKIALLFPGYGSQFVGMGKELYDEYRIVQEYFEEASHVLNNNFVKLCFASSDAELSRMVNAYTSLFLIGAATYAVLKEHGIEPDVVAGYNNGETTALFAAGCFSLPDGLYLLNKFCSFYQEIVEEMDVDSLAVTGVSAAQLDKICKQVSDKQAEAFIVLHDSPTEHVVVGHRNQLAQIQDIIDGLGSMEYVGVEIGLHSSLMNDVVDLFKSYLEKVDFKDLKIPLISCIDGQMVTMGSDVKERFIRHINSPLEWFRVMRMLDDYDCILVAVPGDDLCEMVKKQYPDKIIMSIAKKEDIDTLKEMILIEPEKTGLIDDN
ncbi:MAG TPA: ACP S-malonyltransferase [Candidatus Babeliales bacterium]|jgi:[acyl-carrier-protein] S-malonyltransferase|nr:ACP S-malonyltransferase [Candidatus Babeliales bacterium]